MRAPLRLAACALAAGLVPVPGAAAAPTATVRPYAEATYGLVGSDGRRYVVTVSALAAGPLNAADPSVGVVVSRCSSAAACTVLYRARATVAPAAVAVALDESTAEARATLGGPFVATWTGGTVPGVAGLQAWETPTVRSGSQRRATATVTAFGLRCATAGAVVGHGVIASTADLYAPRSAPLPAVLRAAAGRAPRCAAA